MHGFYDVLIASFLSLLSLTKRLTYATIMKLTLSGDSPAGHLVCIWT